MQMPPVDAENVQFVVFVRSKFGLKKWMPLNVLTGGAQANLLAKGLESDLTKETSMATLKREFAKTIYKDKAQVEEMCRTKMGPTLKFAKELEYGMAIMSREKPKESIMGIGGTDIWVLPAEAELEKTAAEILPRDFNHDYLSESRQYVREGNQLAVTFVFALIIILLQVLFATS